jgi:hypothetical protein
MACKVCEDWDQYCEVCDAVRELSKWVNERPNCEVNIQALITVLNELTQHGH